ncbi:MAG TPA: CbtB-domain containing protein [Alphaproteobacteria bacterium]|nr:CbtB-domain containing protein [Alphaproteobacteria bacterium]
MTSKTISVAVTPALSSRLTAALFVFVLGAALVLITGFSHSQVLHDAAHDARHSMSFPCH